MSIRNRIEKLEQAGGNAREPVIVVITAMVRPGEPAPPLTHLRTDGKAFTREPDETAEDFKHRVARAAGWPAHPVQLIASKV